MITDDYIRHFSLSSSLVYPVRVMHLWPSTIRPCFRECDRRVVIRACSGFRKKRDGYTWVKDTCATCWIEDVIQLIRSELSGSIDGKSHRASYGSPGYIHDTLWRNTFVLWFGKLSHVQKIDDEGLLLYRCEPTVLDTIGIVSLPCFNPPLQWNLHMAARGWG